ncbi:MAG TPA: hypothetical protein VN033_12375 [Vulgatibacter sp.]|nr:hypothetical protein [Vulgatibacter sp.]
MLLLTLGACAMSVGPAHPRPNVFLEEDDRFLSLVLPGSVRDEFQVPSRSGLKPVDVRSWRKTLMAGFRYGFAGAFKLAHSPAASDLTIELLEAAPTRPNDRRHEAVSAVSSGLPAATIHPAPPRSARTKREGASVAEALRRPTGWRISPRGPSRRGAAPSLLFRLPPPDR